MRPAPHHVVLDKTELRASAEVHQVRTLDLFSRQNPIASKLCFGVCWGSGTFWRGHATPLPSNKATGELRRLRRGILRADGPEKKRRPHK